MMESDLHVKVLNSKLNPDLKKYVDVARSELEYAWHMDIPQPEGKFCILYISCRYDYANSWY